jgi:hypothetical protein
MLYAKEINEQVNHLSSKKCFHNFVLRNTLDGPVFFQSRVGMTDGGYEDEFDDTSIFENKSGLAEVSLVKKYTT